MSKTKSKYIESPEKMWEYFEAYKLYAKENPMIKREYVGKDGKEVDTELQVPYTFEGFECYLADQGIIKAGLGDYSANSDGAYTEYQPVVRRIQNNCFVQNFNGAAVMLFNPGLISKKLSMTENLNVNNSVSILSIDPLSDEGTTGS